MLERGLYESVCTSAAAVSDIQRQRLSGTIINALGEPVSEMFPRFASAFPDTLKVMECDYSVPIVLFRKAMNIYIPSLVSEGESVNVFFDLVPLPVETEGPDFEESCVMLPPRWKELYRYFWSFEVTEGSKKSMNWMNTPFSYSGRLTIERYRVLRGVKQSVIRDFVLRTEAESLHSMYCWLLTDSGDALFIDEGKCDGKVYHVKNDDFSDYSMLGDPESVLDQYLAHYLKSRSSSDFDFRA